MAQQNSSSPFVNYLNKLKSGVKTVIKSNPVVKAGDVYKDNVQEFGQQIAPKPVGGTSTPNPLTTQVPYYQSQYSNLQNDNSTDTGGTYTGVGSGATTTEDAQRNSIKGQLQDKFKSLQAVFDGLFGNIDKAYSEKANQVNQQYDLQGQDLGNQFNNTLGQVQNIYGARGLSDSSYLGDKVGQVSKDYYNSLGQIGMNRQSSMSELGQKLSQTKASLDAQRRQYADAVNNLDQYSTADLQALQGTLGSALDNAQVSAQGYLTTPEYVNKLASVNPIANPGTAALAQQLQTLVTSSAPIFAKKEIANGLIKRAQLNDPNSQSYWSSYFQDLLNQNGIA